VKVGCHGRSNWIVKWIQYWQQAVERVGLAKLPLDSIDHQKLVVKQRHYPTITFRSYYYHTLLLHYCIQVTEKKESL
jgi:hypothetical protein